MKFREEVFAKIFTYVTVIVLLGAILFESYVLQTERSARKELNQQLQKEQQLTEQLTASNIRLEERNLELQEFKDMWQDYSSFEDLEDVETLKEDLFSRSDLIPVDAIVDANIHQGAQAENIDEVHRYSFPEEGEDATFVPFRTSDGQNEDIVVYTTANDDKQDFYIELLYTVIMEEETGEPVVNEDGKIDWKCLAYNIGKGWTPLQAREVVEETDEQ